ncbi:MAG: succinate dehydrogenase / fumarate reductase cytochrome b subunit [Chloroflexi bacterium]|jgi:succinate dehydrogenase / fumarate reductase cytochrome b subunit|nr:MAG: succinate dehydrogenase / fumarate reductase cytochrome b subunit [Chloroflexota bacterium]
MVKVAFYPGCVAKGSCPELYTSSIKVCEKLGIELAELEDVGCTGAGVLSSEISDPINARTLAKAEQMGVPLMTICSTCTGVIALANVRLQDPEYRDKINREFLAEDGLEYKGTTEVKHLLWVLVEDVGLDVLTAASTQPLEGVKISPFYGCYLRRPDEAIKDGNRKSYIEKVTQAIGGTNVDISGKGKCCGFPSLTINEENALAMTAKHTSEARDKGADAMVVPCPLCHLELDGQQSRAEAQEKQDIDMPILHLSQLVGMALGFTPSEMEVQRHFVSTKNVEEKVKSLAVTAS